jgi:hypothetical protein
MKQGNSLDSCLKQNVKFILTKREQEGKMSLAWGFGCGERV